MSRRLVMTKATSHQDMRTAYREMSPARAFILIELLTVIAVLSPLVTVLMPSLASAKRRAKPVVCIARPRTLGRGWHVYAMEDSDIAPPGPMDIRNRSRDWRPEVPAAM